MSSGDPFVPFSDQELRRLNEDFDRRVFEQSQSSITVDLWRCLPYQTGLEESGAVEGPSGSRIERASEGVYDSYSDDEFVIATEMLEVMCQPPLCKYAFLSFASLFLERALWFSVCCVLCIESPCLRFIFFCNSYVTWGLAILSHICETWIGMSRSWRRPSQCLGK